VNGECIAEIGVGVSNQALGHKRTFRIARVMSDFSSKSGY